MKARSASLLIVYTTCAAFAEPGGTYTLTGEEKGIEEIVKADMEQYPELYEGENFNSYLSRFKAENKIGYKEYKPGDQLQLPSTTASRRIKKEKAEQGRRAAKIDCNEKTIRFRAGAPVFTDAEKYLYEVPREFGGCKITVREKMSAAALEFEVEEAGVVTLAAVPGDTRALKTRGWTEVGKFLIGRNDDPSRLEILLLSKELESGHYSVPCSANFGTRLLID